MIADDFNRTSTVYSPHKLLITYDDLFRNNESYIGEIVRYTGQVAQWVPCSDCGGPYAVLRIAVTKGSYGLWDDFVWVEYASDKRFLEDDIVTFWGLVTGVKTYTSVLGGEITIPQVQALDIQMGAQQNPVVEAAPGAPSARQAANLRAGPGTNFAVVGGARPGEALNPVSKSADGKWLKLDNGHWISASLVNNIPNDLPIANE